VGVLAWPTLTITGCPTHGAAKLPGRTGCDRVAAVLRWPGISVWRKTRLCNWINPLGIRDPIIHFWEASSDW